jgi:outer membrane protein assembly factor BamB
MRTAFVSLVLLSFVSLTHAGNVPWSQFRGPNGSGIADGQKPPIEFGPDKNVQWKVKAPPGMSSPIVAGDLLVITAFEDGKLYTVAYNRANGKEAWRKEAPAKQIEAYHKIESSPAASTPASDGKHIVSYFGSAGLFCYDLTGKELWRIEMPTAAMLGKFGTGVSPIVADGLVILVRDATKDPKIMAVDIETGKPKWEKKRLSQVSYGTPVIWDTPEGKQIVAPGHARLIAYDLKTGDEKWSVTGIPAGCCNSPIATKDAILFAGGVSGGDEAQKMPSYDDLLKIFDKNKDGVITKDEVEKSELKDFFDHQDLNGDGKLTRDEWDTLLKFMNEGKDGAFAIKPGGSGDITKSHVLWKKVKGVPHVTSAIAYHGKLIMIKDGGIATAYDSASGKQLFQERVDGARFYASPIAANGHVYFASLEDGTVTVMRVDSEKVEIVATNPKLGERVAATPMIADNTLYIRTAGHLYAFGAKK